ncbi:hypothetical protein I3842_09G120500 [Carya illinoinensis]|uniref:Uncharacterized protein n=1 Tax=Carya illinoinensis TaxID=32201 RepID=A0A922E4C1_CARIL|nr:hypothetical protein I3842_09G120500 [Carya illinoinensis]
MCSIFQFFQSPAFLFLHGFCLCGLMSSVCVLYLQFSSCFCVLQDGFLCSMTPPWVGFWSQMFVCCTTFASVVLFVLLFCLFSCEVHSEVLSGCFLRQRAESIERCYGRWSYGRPRLWRLLWSVRKLDACTVGARDADCL